MSDPPDPTRARADRFEIVRDVRAEMAAYSLGLSAEDVPELVAALAKSGRGATGYSIEAFLVILLEVGDPAWARDLVFDSEASRCVVRCRRKGPLRRLAERLTRRLANRAATRGVVVALPPE
jgi:hypothetical protein